MSLTHRTRKWRGIGVRAGAFRGAHGSSLKEVGMVKAVWNGTVIALSDDTVVVENNHYFPPEAVDPAVLRPSATTSICPWKGTAHYHSLVVDGAENKDAAWFYPEPRDAAKQIRGRIAFWKGVRVG
jgi:uncharacterized protein (DUF427 family)